MGVQKKTNIRPPKKQNVDIPYNELGRGGAGVNIRVHIRMEWIYIFVEFQDKAGRDS